MLSTQRAVIKLCILSMRKGRPYLLTFYKKETFCFYPDPLPDPDLETVDACTI